MEIDRVDEPDSYLSSYTDVTVHELMLKDRPRTLAYKNFIEKHKYLFKDKIVMDVGAGTGILSLFTAKAGAKKVYAVECSGISHLCERLVKQNGYSHIITVLKSKVEDVTLDEKVDIIVSEWMGFYLFHESMLFSVFSARDKFLKPEGLVLPTGAHLFACPTSMDSMYKETAGFWKDVYGFDFSPAAEVTMSQKVYEPQIMTLRESDLISEQKFVTAVEAMYAEESEFEDIQVDLKFDVKKYGVIRGLALWFDIFFDVDGEDRDNATGEENCNVATEDVGCFSTSPRSPETHWKQTVIMLPEALLVSPGTTFSCRLILTRNQSDRRKYLLTLGIPEAQEEDDEEEEATVDEEGVNDFEDGEWHKSVMEMIQDKLH